MRSTRTWAILGTMALALSMHAATFASGGGPGGGGGGGVSNGQGGHNYFGASGPDQNR
jgi:hypothetical protein